MGAPRRVRLSGQAWARGGVAAMLLSSAALAQEPASVDGLVQLGKRAGPLPVANQWVVVHRIASDARGGVSGGPLDSARTDARGRYRVRYQRPSGQATYIAITTYAGVSYITSPLTRPQVSGDDALIMVFDTTAPPYPIHIVGRHIVITGPDESARRRVIEVYELLNDSTHTVVGSEANPVWRAPLPPGATDVQVNPEGDISPAMVKPEKDWLKLFTPVSPGIRQVSFTYTLASDAFPLVMPIVDSARVFELLVQEPEAAVEGGNFTEVAGVAQDGVPYRRFLAQNVPPRAVIRFSMPAPVSRVESKAVGIVAAAVSALMLAALGLVWWKRRAARAGARPRAAAANPVEALIRELAVMDAEFEQRPNPSAADRAEFDARRAELKARLNAALAGAVPPA